MSTKSTILNLRLDPEDKAWLESQVEELGLDNVSAVMRALIRRARKGTLDRPPAGPMDGLAELAAQQLAKAEAEERARKEAERQRKAAELRRQLAELEGGDDDRTLEDYVERDRELVAEEFDVPPDSDGGNVTDFKPLPTGFKPPGSLARPAGAANGLVADRSPAGESMKRNYHHLLPR